MNNKGNEEKDSRLLRLLEAKAFDELTAEELSFVLGELGSEQGYRNLQMLHSRLEVPTPSGVKPRAETLLTLQHTFAGANVNKPWWSVITTPVPAYVVGLIIVMAVGIATALLSRDVPAPEQIVRYVVQRDTVKVVNTDTIWRQKVIYRSRYRYVHVAVTGPIEGEQFHSMPYDSTLSVSMKDKQELNELLVTGLN